MYQIENAADVLRLVAPTGGASFVCPYQGATVVVRLPGVGLRKLEVSARGDGA
jgi:hypothetical protein